MATPQMTVLIRLWLLLSRCLSFAFNMTAKRAHQRMGAAPERFSERIGRSSQTAENSVIWFHAASLGEVMQIGPLARQVSQSEKKPILVTTTTKAGADWVARELPDAIHQYAPLDTPAAVRGFLDAWNLSAAVFVEGDFGPRLILKLQEQNIPCVLLNARHSRTRARLSSTFGALLARFVLITCRSDQVAAGIKALGVPQEITKVLPDLRTSTASLPCPPNLVAEISQRIGTRPVWLAASTHPADEEAVLAAHQHALASHPDALLVLAPRHPHRAEPLLAQMQEQETISARRSQGDELTPETQIYLADTLGELGVFFSIAPITFLGGSFGNEGGHNPYEPAQFGSAILSGANVKNFADAFYALSKAGAAELIHEEGALGSRVVELMDTDAAKTMGAAGRTFMRNSENSVAKTADLISSVLSD